MDALSHILDDVHLSHAEYVYVCGHGQWCFGMREQIVFYVILGGSVRLVLPEHSDQTLNNGDIVLIPAGTEHWLLNPEGHWPGVLITDQFHGHRNDPIQVGQGSNTHLVLAVRCFLDVEMAKPLLSSLPRLMVIPRGLDGSGPDWLKLGLDFLALEAERHRPGRDTLLNRLVGMFLVECIRDYIEQLPEGSDNWLSAVRDPYLAPVLSAIHANPAQAWTVVELASIACLSRSAFAERFSEVIGQPPLAYLTEYRLRIAASLLLQNDQSISSISELIGYSSETSFSQAFRRQYGVSPSQYRKGLKEN